MSDDDSRESRTEVNWKLLGVMVVVLGFAVLAWRMNVGQRVTESIEDVGHRDVPPFLPIPDVLPEGTIDQQRDRLTADLAFELAQSDSSIRAFAWEESEGNWTLVFYRRERRGFVTFGSIANPTGFDPPRLVGSPPELRMRDRGLDIDMVFRVVDDDVAMAPADPGLQMIEIDPRAGE